MTTERNDDILAQWPSPSKYRRSLRREFALYIGGMILLLMIITGLIVTDKMVTTVTDNMIDRILAQTRSYAGAASKNMIAADGPDILMLTDICKKLMADSPDCGWTGITDRQGLYLAHTDMRRVIASSRFSPSPSMAYTERLRDGEILQMTDDSIIVSVPIMEQGMTLGALGVGSSTRPITAVRKSALFTVILITAAMILAGIPVTMIILRNRLKPLGQIAESLRKVDAGNIRFDFDIKSSNEFGYLAETLRVMGNHLDLAQKRMIETERLTRELEIAREIQLSILPKKYPDGNKFRFAGEYRSANTVGGDYYDFIDIGNNKLAVVIADVSGKSLPGMLVMLLTRDLVINHARQTNDPARLLSLVNRDLLPEIRKGSFVTMFYGVLDINTGLFQYASAGHNPLIYYAVESNSCQSIKTKGYPLGMMNPDIFNKRIESGEIALKDGDCLIQYTDGINEAMDSFKTEYGMERFISSISSHATLPPDALADNIMTRLSAFVGDAPQSDDMTLLVMKWSGVPYENNNLNKQAGINVASC
jgi:serine phosphatase RsbU (regulator of sigma subunit)